jgi:hypothetical protein
MKIKINIVDYENVLLITEALVEEGATVSIKKESTSTGVKLFYEIEVEGSFIFKTEEE